MNLLTMNLRHDDFTLNTLRELTSKNSKWWKSLGPAKMKMYFFF